MNSNETPLNGNLESQKQQVQVLLSAPFFSRKNGNSGLATQKTPDSVTDNVRFPMRIQHCGQTLATLYGRSKAYPAYRLAWRVTGKRRMERFQTYSEVQGRRCTHKAGTSFLR
ncbi:MAG TPA: hypothetical protein VHZ30_01650 [Verrucomicrobiae bacterium]|jgi:hypothetical protein|nr:hypothetical protein [Verrucomicrobiae bacterium]